MYAIRSYYGKVICQSLSRDVSTEEENEFFIILDTENKNQNGFVFVFSFQNNQRDAVIYNQRNQSYSWDWIWENKATIFKEAKNGKPGYIEAEIKIPVDKIQNKNKKLKDYLIFDEDGHTVWIMWYKGVM